MTDITERIIETLQAEIDERRAVITQLKGFMVNGRKSPKHSPASKSRKWSASRRKKFMATLRKKKAATTV